MALYSLFQEAFTAPTSARDVGQEMLHATLLLSCAFVGWCASTAFINFIQKDPSEGKAKEGSNIFREEVAAYVQANTIKGATKHFGLSRAEIRNCIDAGQKEDAMWKVGQIWQFFQDALPQRETPLPPSPLLQPSKPPLPPRTKSSKAMSPKKSKKTKSLKNHEDEAEHIQADSEQVEVDSEPECEDACTLSFSIAPSLNPGLMLLEQYGVFGAPSGMWSGAVVASPIPRHLLPDIDYSIMEEDEVSEEEEPEDGEDECPQEDHTDSVVEEEPEAEQLELEEDDEAEAEQIEAIEDLEVDELENQMLSDKVEDTTKDDSSFEPSTRSEATDETDLDQDDSYVGQEVEPQTLKTFEEDYSNQASTRGYHDGAMAMEDHIHTQQGWNHNTSHHVQSQPVQVGAAGYHHSCGVIFDANLLQQIHQAEGAVQEEHPQDAGTYYGDNFACSHGYAVSSYEHHYNSGEQYSYDMNANVWVPLEYSW